ncbi:MAG: hypothetical protein N2654_07385, partial [Deltaproteobacteria bacterium]|nr:hypothetical protein [Deltaproteobacteria bacterium]
MRKSFFFLLILTIILAEDEIDSVKARGKTVSSFFQNSAEFYDSYNSSVFSKAPEQSEPPQLGEFKNYDELPRKVKNLKNPKQKPLMPTSRGEII